MVKYLFDDVIVVNQLDPGGKKSNKVSRIVARSEQLGMAVELDVNAEMYPVYVGDKLKMVLAPTLNLDGTPVTNFVSLARGKSLADDFDYVMHGTLYDITKKGSEPNIKQVIHVSFGGLLLELEGDLPKLAIFKRDQTMFLLLKKVQKSLTFKK